MKLTEDKFHFNHKRIRAHTSICFVALKKCQSQ